MSALVSVVGIFLLTVGLGMSLGVLHHRQRLLTKLHSLVFGVLILVVGGLCLSLQAALRSFEAFARSTVIAEVQCRWVGSKEFALTFVPIRDGMPQESRVVRLRGDQWTVEGGIVKWHPWLTALGLPSYHKPTRISGRYATTAEQTQAPPTAFALNGELDPLWWWLYRLDPILPFVKAVYGTAAFVYVNPAMVFEISVSPSGYLIERKRRKPKPPSPPAQPQERL